jgi:hypothetical protein
MRSSEFDLSFVENVENFALIAETSSSALKLAELRVRRSLNSNYNSNSPIHFNVRMRREVSTSALFFINQIAIPYSSFILLVKIIGNYVTNFDSSNLSSK